MEELNQYKYIKGLTNILIIVITMLLLSVTITKSVVAEPACEVRVPGGSDLTKALDNRGPGTVFCLPGDGYTSPSGKGAILQDGDILRGVGDGRSTIVGRGALNVLYADGNNVTIENVDVSRARASEATSPDSGSGLRGGGNHVRVINSRFHHNPNSGIGGMGNNLYLNKVTLDENGWSNVYRNPNGDSTPVSASGIKTNNTATILNSTVYHNGWTGIWCDTGERLVIENTRIIDNAKIGVNYEDCTGPDSRLTGSLIRGNAYLETRSFEGGVRVNSSQDFLISNNTLINNTDRSIEAVGFGVFEGSRGRIEDIRFVNNLIKKDAIPGCKVRGVYCSGNKRLK